MMHAVCTTKKELMSQNKIGLIPLTAIVIGSQVGSGVFMLPQMMTNFGIFAILGWIVSGLGALSLASVFVSLVKRFPKTGGPHVYVLEAFGPVAGYYTGWSYWLISSLSSIAVISAAISYLTPVIGDHGLLMTTLMELGLLGMVLLLNLRGVASASFFEAILSAIKLLTLFFIPLCGLLLFNSDHIVVAGDYAGTSNIFLIGKAASLALWAFLGVEAATTPAGSVKNPTFTIPAAIFGGTSCVIILYLLNSISLMGMIPQTQLANSGTPYVLATQIIFGGNWYLLIAIFAALVCLSNLNAWTLTSGQIASGLAEDHLMPKLLEKKNGYGAPANALFLSCGLAVPFVILTMDANLSRQIFAIIDFAVQVSLLIYIACACSLIKTLYNEHHHWWHYENIIAYIAIIFCLSMCASSDLVTLVSSLGFVASGLPLHYFWLRHQTHKSDA